MRPKSKRARAATAFVLVAVLCSGCTQQAPPLYTISNDRQLVELAATERDREVRELVRLRISMPVTPAQWQTLAALGVSELYYSSRELSEADIAGIAKLRWLSLLDVSGTDLADQKLSRLQPLKALRDLDVSETPITDASVESLLALPGLRYLDVSNTHLTEAAVHRLWATHRFDLLMSSYPMDNPSEREDPIKFAPDSLE